MELELDHRQLGPVHLLYLYACLSYYLSLPSNMLALVGDCRHCYAPAPSSGLGLDSPFHKCLAWLPHVEENL